RSLKPGGLLFANFDVRPKSPENALHLYSNDLPLRWVLHRTGFEPEESLDGTITRYRRTEAKGLGHLVRGLRDFVGLRSPLRPLYRSTRRYIARRLRRATVQPTSPGSNPYGPAAGRPAQPSAPGPGRLR